MRGCLSLPFRLVTLAVLILVGYVAWHNRDELRRWVHRQTADPPSVAQPSEPAERLRQRGLARFDSLQRGRADSVVLSAPELAAMLAVEVAELTNGAVDSVGVDLYEGEVGLRARLDTDRLPAGALGPAGSIVSGRQPVEARGAITLRRAGVAEWRVTQVKVRSIPLPRAVWTRLPNLPGTSSDGVVTFPVPSWVSGVRATSQGVILFGAVAERRR